MKKGILIYLVSIPYLVTAQENMLHLLSFTDTLNFDELNNLSIKNNTKYLVIINSAIYIPASDCLPQRNLAGGTGDRNLAGGTGDRNLAGGTGDRNLAGGTGDRNLAGGTGDRNLAGGTGDRNLAVVGGACWREGV